jgi:hypothetical protein
MPLRPRDLETSELIDQLRRAAAIWFRNDHLMILEELIRRVAAGEKNCPDAGKSDAAL